MVQINVFWPWTTDVSVHGNLHPPSEANVLMEATATTTEELSATSAGACHSANETCVPFSPTSSTASAIDD